jgi:ABC-type antimicrobial peptide transport system permease subunit
MFVGMGAVALGLAALGLYGVLAYAVTRRMREFAVRIALGAEPRRLLKMVLYDGFVMLLAGIGIGAFAALMASRWLDSVLIAVLPSDVVTLVISEAVLITAGVGAALVPARRASRANPLDILRAT